MNLHQMMNLHTRIVVPPKWITVLPTLLADLERGTDKHKNFARDELTHMAQVADLAKEAMERRSELLFSAMRFITEYEKHEEDEWSEGLKDVAAAFRSAIAKEKGAMNADHPS